MKVLVSAYACEPDKGSEPGVGWNWVCAIAAHHEVWICTKGNNRESIERELNANPNRNVHFIYVDVPRVLSFWKKGQRGVHLYYYLWQFVAFCKAIRLHRKLHFDMGHHITFVNAWMWTFLALMPIPFIWGPIGTNAKLPPQLLPNAKERAKYWIRYRLQGLMRTFDPLYWLSAIRADLILVINKETGNLFPLRFVAEKKIIVEPAIGTEKIEEAGKRDRKNGVFNVLYAGRFITIKGAHLAIEAFTGFSKRRENVHFTVIGEGPLEKGMRDVVRKNHSENIVTFSRWMPRSSVLEIMQTSDVFLFPTMEGSGMVVLEAMAAGLPVVCLNWGGPRSLVDGRTGIRVKVEGYEQTIESLAKALEYLYDNPEIMSEMGRSALERVSDMFTWNQKIRIIDKYYENLKV
jgi:glycosyltransferase involved in cell wall biosynthesis